MGDYSTALKDARKCVKTKPDWPKGYSRTGLALFKMGKYEESKKEYEKGLKIAPDNATLKEGLMQADRALHPDPMAKMFDDSMWAKLHNDPVTREYLQDNQFKQKLRLCQQNPQLITSLMQTDERMKAAMGVLLGLGASWGAKEAPAKEAPAKKAPAKKKEPDTKPMEDDTSDDSAEEIEMMTDEEKAEKKKKR